MKVTFHFKAWRPFILRIALPSIFTISLCLFFVFVVIIPSFEKSMMAGKKEMIRELTNSAWSMINQHANKVSRNNLDPEEVKLEALASVETLRYGPKERDYFWITDTAPRMLMHPIRSDLNGHNLGDFKDTEGKRLFAEAVETARTHGDGYIRYIWEDKVNPERMVPKLSYVRFFEPWGWVIGTGVYLEDVEQEIVQLTRKLLRWSLFITAIIGILLVLITREVLKIEARRQEQEASLKESHEKYRHLVEGSREGLILVLSENIVHFNRFFQELTGYSGEELFRTPINNLLGGSGEDYQADEFTQKLLWDDDSDKVEARLQKKDGTQVDVLISCSPIEIGGKPGHVISVSDLTKQKEISSDAEQDQEQYKYRDLIENINVGIFRTTVGKNSRFIDANPACVSIFGLNSQEELFAVDAWSMFLDSSERNAFLRKFSRDGSIKHYPLRLHHQDGKLATVSISAVLVRDEAGKPLYCDGFIEDISDVYRFEAEQKRLIGELQTALLFLNEPISRYASGPLHTCRLSTPVSTVSRLMTEEGCSAMLVQAPEDEEYVGIVTDQDIRKRYVAGELIKDTPVSQIMSAPLVWVSEDALMFEGMLTMLDNKIGHIVVKDINGTPVQVVGVMQFLRNQKYPLAMLLRDINQAETPEQLFKVRERLPLIIRASYASGPDSRNMTRIISAAAEAVTKKCIAFATETLGPPPCGFTFMTLGSVGREEQTLVTDQDNAIVYHDVPDDDGTVAEYFLKFGEMVCTWLDRAGYAFCDGEIMAMNPKWCQPLSTWMGYFEQWVSTSEPVDLLETKIFFDFRGVYGDLKLIDKLRNQMQEMVSAKPLFLYLLVQNCLQFKPPLGMFRNIVVESAGEHREKFSIKKAMTPIIDYARIYALKHGISQTGTLARLAKLVEGGHIARATYEELLIAYRYLLEQRFKHQILGIEEGKEPDNHVNPKELTEMEQAFIREAMSQISSVQTKMSFDVTGSA